MRRISAKEGALSQLFDLKGKRALITGGGTGLGRAMAHALAEAGADVVLAARRKEKLDAAAGEIRALGRAAHAVRCDLTRPDSILGAVREAEEALGAIDILVNNSGVSGEGWAAELPLARWNRVLETNLRGAFLMCQAVGPAMAARGGGAIVNVASVAGLIGVKMLAAYAASKGGVIQLTKTLALEWAKTGVRVNALAPGYFLTDINRKFFGSEAGDRMIRAHIPMGRVGRPEEIRGAILFLASDASSFMTGAVLVVDGGQYAQ